MLLLGYLHSVACGKQSTYVGGQLSKLKAQDSRDRSSASAMFPGQEATLVSLMLFLPGQKSK